MEKMLKEYAKLLIKVGANLQKDQKIVISAPVDCAAFARLCASAAYDAGASEVIMSWSDDYLTREKYLRASDRVFDTFPCWQKHLLTDNGNDGAAMLYLYASDPENLKGVDPDRLLRAEKCAGEALDEYREMQMRNDFPWCVASLPIPSWAEKVFPSLPSDDAVEALWKGIFSAVRITGNGDSTDLWREHIETLTRRGKVLNEYAFRSLHYTNSLGTDLYIELPDGHIWLGGTDETTKGQTFTANIPTEEIFTAPKRDGVNGRVVASLPLVKDGNIIDGIVIDFKDGKAVSVHADSGEDILKSALAVDDGASYLGEVALVPYDSPISNMKTLFFNTLFDENASCHLALGDSYPCVDGGQSMSREELAAKGLNKSIIHEDFMIGTPDLSIVGTTEKGEQIPVFIDGNFAF